MYLSLKMYVVSLAFLISACFASPVLAQCVGVGVGSAALAALAVFARRSGVTLDATLIWHRSRAFWLSLHS
jgi:hypothetical protein